MCYNTVQEGFELILASSSPRRQQFMSELGLDFDVQAAAIDETPRADEQPRALALRLARDKANAVAARLTTQQQPALVIACDTVVAMGERQLGKPANRGEARAMLQALRARTHIVYTALCLRLSGEENWEKNWGRTWVRMSATKVTMRNYSDAEIESYIDSGDPFDKAGGYAIQHPDFAPVEALDGCASGVVGFPLADLRDLLAEAGVVIEQPLPPICERRVGFACCQREAATND